MKKHSAMKDDIVLIDDELQLAGPKYNVTFLVSIVFAQGPNRIWIFISTNDGAYSQEKKLDA